MFLFLVISVVFCAGVVSAQGHFETSTILPGSSRSLVVPFCIVASGVTFWDFTRLCFFVVV